MSGSRIAVISDIHSNLEALQAVVDDARGRDVSDFVCLGDIVGYNANPHECVEFIRKLVTVAIRGNHDHYCTHNECLDDFQPTAANVIAWTRRQLEPADVAWLAGLPYSKTTPGGVTYVHGTLDSPEHWGYVFDNLDAAAHFAYQRTGVCFHGHTHAPVVFTKRGTEIVCYDAPTDGPVTLSLGEKYLVNVGSVGQPRDGEPGASYVIFSPKDRTIEFRRVDYDIDAAAGKVLDAGLPPLLAERLRTGR